MYSISACFVNLILQYHFVFLYQLENKNSDFVSCNCDFICQNATLYLAIASLFLIISSLYFKIAFVWQLTVYFMQLYIVTLYQIVALFPQARLYKSQMLIHEFISYNVTISHSCNFISCNCDFISENVTL